VDKKNINSKEINSSRELMNNQLLNLKNNSNVLYSNPMIKNIYTQKIEMEKNSKLHKPEIIHKIVVSDENGNNKEIAFNTNTLSKLNLRNKNTDFSMLYSEDNEEYQKIKDSIIQLNDQPLPNVIIIENMDSASPIIQDAILQVKKEKK